MLKDMHPRTRWPGRLLPGLLLLVLSGICNADNQVPEIGSSLARLDPQDEYLLGRSWLHSSSSDLPILLNAPLLQDYITQLAQEIASYSGLTNIRLKVVLLKDPSINAFAAPGGIIGINLGLLTQLNNEDELASVLAHEFGHVRQRHMLEIIARAKNRSALTYGAFLAGLGMMLTGNPALGFAAVFSGVANNANLTLDAIRLNEEEADSLGFETMVKAGRAPSATLHMSERLYQQNRDGNMPSVFSSHPLSSQRITAMRNRLVAYQNQPGSAPPNTGRQSQLEQDFDMHVAQVLAGMYLAISPADYLNKLLQSPGFHNSSFDQANQLGLAAVYNQLGKPDAALKLLEQLIDQRPLHYYLNAEYATALRLKKLYPQALLLVENQLALHPDNYLLQVVKLQILLDSSQQPRATQMIERMLEQDSENLWLWNQLYELSGKLGKIATSHYAMGYIHYLLGNNQFAISQLSLAAEKATGARLKSQANNKIASIRQQEARIASFF